MASGDPVFSIGKGNTTPALAAALLDATSLAVNLTAATATFNFYNLGGALIFSRAATITSSVGGLLNYPWQAGDTATVGVYLGRFIVTFSGGLIQSFPNDRFIQITVT